ncbi:response regulator transcription factor [Streptomyces sp. NPDC047081]|uniref:response regulator transcription factor n=1 Tax=Streptomyces sp. NPDC047081 TaxID=3154706 RepID=UPI0033F26EB7
MPDPTSPHPGSPQPPPPNPFEDFPPPAPATPLRVVVADDNPVVRAGLTALLSGRADITVVAEAADGREAYEATNHHHPDVVLLDVRMPGVDGISALPYLAPLAPVVMLTYSRESQIVQEALRRGAGGYLVHGEFTADQLVAAVRDITAGRPHFTPTAAGALLAQLRETPAGAGTTLPEDLGSATAHKQDPPTPRSEGIFMKGLSRLQPDVGQSWRLSTREAEIMDLIASGMNNQQIAATCFISEKTVKNHINRIFAKLHSTSRSEATAKWLGTAPRPDRGLG